MGLGLSTLSSTDRKMVVTTTSIRGIWIERFIKLNKKRKGSTERKSGLLGEVLHALLENLEEY